MSNENEYLEGFLLQMTTMVEQFEEEEEKEEEEDTEEEDVTQEVLNFRNLYTKYTLLTIQRWRW